MGDLIGQAREALAEVEQRREAERERHRVEMDALTAEARKLRAAISALEGKQRPRRTAAKQAGPAALDAVRNVLARGEASQAKIVQETKLNEGTVSYAVRALTDAGEIEATGEVTARGSRVFRARTAAAA
jgi:hypothetical protein